MPQDPKQKVNPSPGFLERWFGIGSPVQNPPLPPAPHDTLINLPPVMQRNVSELKRQGLSPASNPMFRVPELGSSEHLDMTRQGMGADVNFASPGLIRMNPIMAHGVNTPDEQLKRTLLHEMSHVGEAANANPLQKLRVAAENRFLPYNKRTEENRARLEAEQLLARNKSSILARQR